MNDRVITVSDERLARVEEKITHLDQSVIEIHEGVKTIQADSNKAAIDLALLCKDTADGLKLVSIAIADNKALSDKVYSIESEAEKRHNELRIELITEYSKIKTDVVKLITIISVLGAVIMFFRGPITSLLTGS